MKCMNKKSTNLERFINSRVSVTIHTEKKEKVNLMNYIDFLFINAKYLYKYDCALYSTNYIRY